MLLKSLMAGLFLIVGVSAQATLLVPAYNENYCPNISGTVTVVRESPNDAHLFETHRLLKVVEKWNKAFIDAGDAVLIGNSLPLCVGLMDDGGNPNAGAVGRQFLLMGVSLISMLENENGVGTEAKIAKEKFVLAHEFAHILQNLHDLKFNYILPMLSTKIKEQHADCMAAYMLDVGYEIPLNLSSDLELFIENLADAHIVGDHGTAEQRISAYRNGRALGGYQRVIMGTSLSDITSTQLVQECGVHYRPTNW